LSIESLQVSSPLKVEHEISPKQQMERLKLYRIALAVLTIFILILIFAVFLRKKL